MGKQTGLDFARSLTRTKLRRVRVTAERTRIVNERDTICATESEGVVLFNTITLGAAFHVFGGTYPPITQIPQIQFSLFSLLGVICENLRFVECSRFIYSGRFIRFNIALNRGSERNSSTSGVTANVLAQ